MSRKKRMFDIDMPDDVVAPETETEPAKRRGPMASAISENAEALKERRSAAEAIRAENDALAHEFVALKDAGHVVQLVPLDEVHTDLLVRDRMPGDDPELEELITSIRDVGLSNPIRVTPRPLGQGYELIQGYRRLHAYRALRDENSDEKAWHQIPALIVAGDVDIAGFYRRMVDENVIRKDLSFAEMARAAQAYVADPETAAVDLGGAIGALFQSAPYSKRSYIRAFASLLDALEGTLDYPTAIPRALGVALSRAIKEDPDLAKGIRADLKAHPKRGAEKEMAILKSFVDGAGSSEMGAAAGRTNRAAAPKTKTTFHIKSSAGQVKCTAAAGRLEIKVDRDFSSIDRARLERAIADLVDGQG